MLGRLFKKKLSQEEAQALFLEGVLTSDLKKIDKALEAGANIDHHYSGNKNIIDSSGNVTHHSLMYNTTALYHALNKPYVRDLSEEERESKERLALELLERGANPLEEISPDTTPVKCAAYFGLDKFIAAVAAKYPLEDLRPVLNKVIFDTDNIKGMQALVAAGADINFCVSKKTDSSKEAIRTPLYWHVTFRHREDRSRTEPYFHALLDAGADIFVRTSKGVPVRDTLTGRWNSGQQKEFLDSIVTPHLDKLRQQLACEPGAGIDPQRLMEDGKPTTELLHYCGAHMLPELFTEHRWKGKESKALALFEEIRPLLPDYYKPMLDAIDLTPLRRGVPQKENGPMVTRYVRPRSATPEVAP